MRHEMAFTKVRVSKELHFLSPNSAWSGHVTKEDLLHLQLLEKLD